MNDLNSDVSGDLMNIEQDNTLFKDMDSNITGKVIEIFIFIYRTITKLFSFI